MVVIMVGIVVGLAVFLKIDRIDKESVGDVAYEVAGEEDIPGEVMEEIRGYGKGMKRGSFLCNDKMYIVVYYGEQVSEGYSVKVNKLYESETAIFVETVLMGPASFKEAQGEVSYPYIVIRVPVSGKKVVFI